MPNAPEQKIALVTGASRGIGKTIAEHLANTGHTVVGTATSPSGAAAIGDYLKSSGGQGMALDICDSDQAVATVKAITSDIGPITVLVNNAGVTRDNLLMRMKDEEWQTVIDTNLSGLFRMSKACTRGMMKARWGRIINIGSVMGSMGNAGQSNYAAAKAGLIGFTKALARELGSRNITVNAVAPGFIETDMTLAMSDEQRADMQQSIPLQRLGSTADIAAAVGFLASDSAGYISGETLHVNGGMYMI
ncbi:MAG: 3-oxoacyl-ACP reductase FabG [Gammaproteobacteria bacterium]|nr:3-oxoacyl-ACP reductase FabG [Gammaproteobacteria bacterium]